MPDMTEQTALETAIEVLGIECARLANEARDWQRYGDDLQFNRQESKNAADTIARYEKARGVLQLMVTQLRRSAE